jgi:hypothetical protein
MLGRVQRHWWRVVGGACLICALWFYYRGTQIDRQWDERTEETERKWDAIGKQLREHAADIHEAPNDLAAIEAATKIINRQTEQIVLQKEELRATRQLYYEKTTCYDLYIIITSFGFLVIAFGRWRARVQARRARGSF